MGASLLRARMKPPFHSFRLVTNGTSRSGWGVAYVPWYPGSRYEYTRVMPVVSVLYERFFFGGAPGAGTPGGIGMNIVKNEHWRFGVGFGAETLKPQYASDDPVLRGWGDIRSAQRGSAFGSYTLDWFSARAAISQDIGGTHEDALVSLGMEGRLHPIDRLTLSAAPEAVCGDKYNQTFFGIDSTQRAILGLREYPVRTGFQPVRFAVGAGYRLIRKWLLSAHAAYG